MTRVAVLPALVAATYRCHALHGSQRIWAEKNCYVDVWIELLQALGLDPHACLPFVFGVDFEGDQWTFFKPPLPELRTLYGIDVQEMSVWRPLVEHAFEHLASGRWVSVEVDAFWLPDTAATDYRRAHGKTTIVLNDLDHAARRLGYFHNAGYYLLEGDDFERLFASDGAALAPYAELIHIDRRIARTGDDLRAAAAELLASHLAWLPRSNPVVRFGQRLEADLPVIRAGGLECYHRWAFAGIRQLGASAELAACFLSWLRADGEADIAVASFELIAQQSKTLLLKIARAVNSGRPLEHGELVDAMSAAWDRGTAAVVALAR